LSKPNLTGDPMDHVYIVVTRTWRRETELQKVFASKQHAREYVLACCEKEKEQHLEYDYRNFDDDVTELYNSRYGKSGMPVCYYHIYRWAVS